MPSANEFQRLTAEAKVHKDFLGQSHCRRCGISAGAAIAGVLCDPPHAGSHDFPVCNCNQRGGYRKGTGLDPAKCPVHGDTSVTPSGSSDLLATPTRNTEEEE